MRLASMFFAAVCIGGPWLSLKAAEPMILELWPGLPPDESGSIGPERFRMSPKLDRKQVEVTEQTRLITGVTNPTISIFRAAKEKETGTAIVICPGGGYWDLYWQLEGEEVAAWLNSIGVTGIILKYRVPRRPDEPKGEPARRPLQDAQRAISLIRTSAGEWGINPRRIGIMGFSAGGHLAIATATSFGKRSYTPVDNIDQESCRPDFAVPVYSGYLKTKEKDELAPGIQVPTNTPPVFLVHGGEDIISPPEHSVLMYLALKRAGVPAELHVYANTAHDFGARTNTRPYSKWPESCADWLRDQGFLQREHARLSPALNNPAARAASTTNFIRVSTDGTQFVFSDTGARFIPWGFNYDHDASNRLLETYWNLEWDKVAGDFQEMKALGANTVRVHLQVSKFMKTAEEPNQESLDLLTRLLRVAETNDLHLDITGLGCYDKPDVPKWYNDLNEGPRWEVQARFWEAVARTCGNSPAVFCYDLMNEPVISEDKTKRDWTPGAFGDRYFVQRLTLDLAGRTQTQIAKAWIDKLVGAIRKFDQQHLVTVGAIPWALTWPNAKPVFYSKEASANLDFVSVHFYPKKGEVAKALKALAVYNIGKPIVIEEMFPLSCSLQELDEFIEGSRKLATGWVGFYWGKTIHEYENFKPSIADDLTRHWLEYFEKKAAGILDESKR